MKRMLLSTLVSVCAMGCLDERSPPYTDGPGAVDIFTGRRKGPDAGVLPDAGTPDGGLSDAGTESTALPGASTQAGLAQFLDAGSYVTWKSEVALHTSAAGGVHGAQVKVYANPTLYASLKGLSASHPSG